MTAIMTQPVTTASLRKAIDSGNWVAVKVLLDKGQVSKDVIEKSGLLHQVVSSTDISLTLMKYIVDKICSHHVDINSVDEGGMGVLHRLSMSSETEHDDVLFLLLNKGADINLMNTSMNLDLRDSNSFTLYIRAVQKLSADSERVNSNNHTVSVIRHLLDSGVDTEARSPDGMTAFEMAVQCNNWPAILALLPRCEVKIGDNVLLKGTQYLHELAKQKDIRDEKLRPFTKTLLEHGVNINEVDSDGHSPLIVAAKHKNWNYVVLLLQHGAEGNVNVNNKSLLHFIIANHRDIPRALFTALLDAIKSRGVDFNSLDHNGRSILFNGEVYSTVSDGQDSSSSLFSLLVDIGVNPLVVDFNGHSLLRFTLDLHGVLALNLVKFLVQAGVTTHQPSLTEAARTRTSFSVSVSSSPSPTQAAFEMKNVQAFKLLVESGASANSELFELSAQYKAKYVVRSKTKAETQMLDILNRAASQPRSLKSLCRLTVSHALGCGLRRKKRILILPIPPSLQQYILFCDILSEEFLTSEDKTENRISRRLRVHVFRNAPRNPNHGRVPVRRLRYYEPFQYCNDLLDAS